MATDQPPPYAYAFTNTTIPAPLYSEQPRTHERVLHSERHPTGLAPPSQDASLKHLYKSDHLDVRLHPPHWGLTLPAYGQGGTVDGFLAFRKKCTHVVEVSVSLRGVISTSASQHATVAVPGVSRSVILKKRVVLFSSAAARPGGGMSGKGAPTIPAGEEYPFAIQFPSHVEGAGAGAARGSDALPPSYTVYQPGISTEISYQLRVDVVRKGWRRHEKLCVPVLYLPKSRPALPSVEEVPWVRTDTLARSLSMSAVEMVPTWLPRQTNVQQQQREDLPRISLTMASSKCFASGEMIAVALKIECPRSPALVRLLSHNAHLSLVKRQKTWISLGAQISIREQIVSRADLYLADESQEGTAYLRLEVQAGEPGRECSWRVKDCVAVEHVMRLVILPPEHLKDFPMFKYEVPLTLTTDQYGTEQSELLAMGGIPFPALGLNNVHRYLRPSI